MIAKNKELWWKYNKENEIEIGNDIRSLIKQTGSPYLEERNSIKKLTAHYKGSEKRNNKYIFEALAYGYILINDYKKSEQLLRSFHSTLAQDILKSPDIFWVKAIPRTRTDYSFLSPKSGI